MARRRRQEELSGTAASRDKTLEPSDVYTVNPLTRSATTCLNGGAGDPPFKKERTPYKLLRHRHKYTAGDRVTRDLTAALNSRELQPSATLRTAAAVAAAAADKFAYDPIRRKDTLYDAYGAERRTSIQQPLRHNADYYTQRSGLAEKENHMQYQHNAANAVDANNNLHHQQQQHHDTDTFADGVSDRERERKRAIRSYKRTCTANDRRHTTAYKDPDAINAGAAGDERPTAGRFQPRQSAHAYQRSRTQQFFDAENQLSAASTAAAAAAAAADNPVLSEREARRKEIQGLIAKYAQLDDAVQQKRQSTALDSADSGKAKSNGMYGAAGGGLGLGLAAVQPTRDLLALSKTQSMANMPSVLGGRSSRIPKALLTTFVRIRLCV